jgi:phosphomannomutase/phosphomannomutase/phosphoglucomutase
MKNIFRQYDIRGVVGRDLDNQTMDQISRAFAAMAKQKGYDTVLVGRDNRSSSPQFRDTVVNALQDSGCHVIDLGLVITPIFYFAARYLNIPAGMMITASHNGGEYNGCKLLLGESTIYGEQIQEIRRMVESQNFIEGARGSLKYVDIAETYRNNIRERIKMGAKRLKIVVDCGNGAAGLFAPEVFRSLGCEVIELYCESDPSFPHHHPDPVNPDNMVDLIKVVQEHQADLGIGIDGDGDRLGVVDSSGNMIWGDLLMILFWRDILPRYPDLPCIVEVKCSQSLIDEIVKLGGEPLIYKTGHSLIKAKMKESGAIFTGEMSGHMFFADEYYGFDDALYAGARLLALLSKNDADITEMLADINIYYATPEIRVSSSDDEKFQIVEEVKAYFKDKYPINDIDGARVMFPHGWALVRASNTGPELIVRCEGKTPEYLEQIKAELFACLQKLGLEVNSLQACQV